MELWVVGLLVGVGALVIFRRQILAEIEALKSNPRAWGFKMWKEWGEPFVVAALIAFAIRTFALGPYKIPSGSMIPTLLQGDRIFVDKLSYRFREPKRGEVIVFKFPMEPKKDFVKRLIAFGGETVEIRDGIVYVDGKALEKLAMVPNRYYYNRNDWAYGKENQKIHVPAESFFVLGDNSAQSSDSRNWGFVPKKMMVGRAFLIFWPFNRAGFVS